MSVFQPPVSMRNLCDTHIRTYLMVPAALLGAAILQLFPSTGFASRAPINPVLQKVHANTLGLTRFAANKPKSKATENEVDSEDIFGFTSGTDLPEKGQKQGEFEFVGTRGKQDGSYTALTKAVALKYMALTDTRFAVTGAMAYHNISGVTGLEDLNRLTPQSLGFEM
jgi:hypothetical protein